MLKLRSATYDVGSHTVTLTLAKPIKLKKPVQPRIGGTAVSGLSDAFGRLIDGDHDGRAGGDATAVLTRRAVTLSRAAAIPAAGLVNAVLGQGGLGGLLPPSRKHR